MKKFYLLTILLSLLFGKSFNQNIIADTIYYNEEGAHVPAKEAVTRSIKKTSDDESYTLEKYNLKNKTIIALEIYGNDGLPEGKWKVYDNEHKQLRTLNFEDAIKFQATTKDEIVGTPGVPTVKAPDILDHGDENLELEEPVLKPGKYNNFTDYFNHEFYLNEGINNYLNEVQPKNIRILLTISPAGKVTHLIFKPDPGQQLKREIIRVLLNSPELVPPSKRNSAITPNAVFSLRLRVE